MIKHSSRTDLNVQPLSLEQRWIQAPSPLNTPINGGLGVPFGNGLRCVGGSIKRLGVRFAGADGSASWVRISSIEVWGSSPLAGDTRAFQGWYRDISGGGCASLFNLTNGYAVTYSG